MRISDWSSDVCSSDLFDAADPESVKAMVEKTVAQFGRLDILHNNAALTDPERQGQDTTAIDIPVEIWNATLTVNATGRSEERRAGKECVSTGRSRWSA